MQAYFACNVFTHKHQKKLGFETIFAFFR